MQAVEASGFTLCALSMSLLCLRHRPFSAGCVAAAIVIEIAISAKSIAIKPEGMEQSFKEHLRPAQFIEDTWVLPR
jgi:hypothetical protein